MAAASVKCGSQAYMIPMVCDICTIAILFSVSQPFFALHILFYEGHSL